MVMPKANWGVNSQDIDKFDRDSQYTPYDGPIPENAVYHWKIKVLKSIAGTKSKLPQLRVGLELVPRKGRNESKYKGYFVMAFIPVSDKTEFRYVPFLDAIGVTGREFTRGTITDDEGNIKKIGKWRNDGDEIIAAELKTGEDQDGNPRKEIGWMGEPNTEPESEEDDDEDDFDDYDDEDDEEDDDEEDDDDYE